MRKSVVLLLLLPLLHGALADPDTAVAALNDDDTALWSYPACPLAPDTCAFYAFRPGVPAAKQLVLAERFAQSFFKHVVIGLTYMVILVAFNLSARLLGKAALQLLRQRFNLRDSTGLADTAAEMLREQMLKESEERKLVRARRQAQQSALSALSLPSPSTAAAGGSGLRDAFTDRLSRQTLETVFAFLTSIELVEKQVVCRVWNDVGKAVHIWDALCVRELAMPARLKPSDPMRSKAIFTLQRSFIADSANVGREHARRVAARAQMERAGKMLLMGCGGAYLFLIAAFCVFVTVELVELRTIQRLLVLSTRLLQPVIVWLTISQRRFIRREHLLARAGYLAAMEAFILLCDWDRSLHGEMLAALLRLKGSFAATLRSWRSFLLSMVFNALWFVHVVSHSIVTTPDGDARHFSLTMGVQGVVAGVEILAQLLLREGTVLGYQSDWTVSLEFFTSYAFGAGPIAILALAAFDAFRERWRDCTLQFGYGLLLTAIWTQHFRMPWPPLLHAKIVSRLGSTLAFLFHVLRLLPWFAFAVTATDFAGHMRHLARSPEALTRRKKDLRKFAAAVAVLAVTDGLFRLLRIETPFYAVLLSMVLRGLLYFRGAALWLGVTELLCAFAAYLALRLRPDLIPGNIREHVEDRMTVFADRRYMRALLTSMAYDVALVFLLPTFGAATCSQRLPFFRSHPMGGFDVCESALGVWTHELFPGTAFDDVSAAQGFLGSLLQLAALALVTPLCTLGHVLAARWFAIWCVK